MKPVFHAYPDMGRAECPPYPHMGFVRQSCNARKRRRIKGVWVHVFGRLFTLYVR